MASTDLYQSNPSTDALQTAVQIQTKILQIYDRARYNGAGYSILLQDPILLQRDTPLSGS